ncbi:hypothetical protein BH23GEM6_BH23GEM6_11790 [soil metagenome]
MTTNEAIIDREVEVARLRQLSDSGELKLGLLYGRRRVGRTYLQTHLWDPKRAFYFTASATTPELNGRVLIEEAAPWSGENLREVASELNVVWEGRRLRTGGLAAPRPTRKLKADVPPDV